MTQPEDTLNSFLGEKFWAEDDLLRNLRADLAERAPTINIDAETGATIATVLKAAGAKRVLEVGTLFGYSGVWIARALPADGHLDTLELNEMHATAAAEWFAKAGLSDRVTVHQGPALTTLESLTGPYDAAFIDADKENYPAYFDHALRLVRPGGMIMADNIHRRGALVNSSVDDEGMRAIRELIDRLAAEPRVHSTVLGVGDGVSLSVLER